MSYVVRNVSKIFLFCFLIGGAIRWKVCCQLSLPRLVFCSVKILDSATVIIFCFIITLHIATSIIFCSVKILNSATTIIFCSVKILDRAIIIIFWSVIIVDNASLVFWWPPWFSVFFFYYYFFENIDCGGNYCSGILNPYHCLVTE